MLFPNLILNAPVPLALGFLAFLLRALFTCGLTSETKESGAGKGGAGGAGVGGGGANGGGGGGDGALNKHIKFPRP